MIFCMDLQQQNKLLYSRAGFGISLEDYKHPQPINKAVDNLFPKATPGALEMITAEEWAQNSPNALKAMDDDAGRKEMKKAFNARSKDMNLLWVQAMVDTSFPLLEKTALFWHGHFATHINNPYYDQVLLDVIRKNALGNFGDMLRGVSKSSAMLQFLNNRQNKKQHPNENFAREVMELFTMGRGNYSEDDVKEAARSFTGWGADLQGEFVFRQKQHDNGDKTLLGKTGNFDGDDVLNILLQQKETAHFISKKIYRFLVNDDVDEQKAAWLGNRFYQSNYDIKSLLEDIFSSEWFYAEKNVGARIKSPVELIVGIRRMLPMKIDNEESQLTVQAVLGQLLFYPPNVAGWPGGTNWIDSSSLMFRLRIPQIIYAADEFEMKPKDDDDVMMGRKEINENAFKIKGLGKVNGGQMIRAEIFWNDYLKEFESVPKENLITELGKTILQTPSGISDETLKKYIDASGREYFIKTATIQLMSTPEYQLC